MMKKLFLSIFLLALCATTQAQCTLLANAVAGMTLVHQNTNCNNNSGVAYNPILGLYYAVRAGNSSFPLETWTSAGVPLFQTTAGFDWRGMWWNPLTNQLEGNGYSTSGLWKADLNGTGWALSTGLSINTGMNQPDAQSCGDFDCQANEVLYYFNGSVYRYSRATAAFLGSYPITGTPVPISNLNSTTLMYTGCLGKEIALLDYVNNAVYVYNKANGAYVGMSQLPVGAITSGSFKTSWANCKVWLFNLANYTWYSYEIFNSCTSSCISCPPVFTTQNLSICSGDSVLVGGAYQTTAGVYVDSLTTFTGCDSILTSTLTVTALPVVTVNSPTICTGQTANLSAGGATSYTWSAGVTVTGINTADATPASTTTYTVTGTTSGCNNTAVATVTVVPSLTVTVNSPSICSGQTANLTASGANTYTWTAGATSTGVNTANATPVLTTTYTVTGTSGSCSATAVSTVTVNNNPVVTVNSPSICSGQTATLTAGGATTYSWSAGATTSGTNTATAAPLTTTTYTVTGTTGSCTGTAVSTVTVNASPVVTVNSPTICAGQTANLTATGATTYTWSAGATGTGGGNATASPAATTTYTVTGTTGTCSDTAISTVTVNPNPVIVVNSPSVCAGQIATLTATGAASYTWSAGAVSSGGGSATANPIVTTTYTVTGTTGSCTGTAVSTVTIINNPTILVNSPAICSGQTALLAATGATSYTWSAGATSTGGGNATATPASTTSYTVTGTTSGCSNTAIATVTVTATPSVTVTSDTICTGQTANLTATGATTYTWSAGAMGSVGGNATASPTSTTTYTVTGTTAGCSSSTVASVTVNSCVPPIANLFAYPLTICNSGCVTFSDMSVNSPTTWLWHFPGGIPATANVQGPINVCYTSLGQYSVTLVVSNIHGTDSITIQNYVNVVAPTPFSISGNTMLNACESSHLTTVPLGTSYLWGPSNLMSCNTCPEAIVSPTVTTPVYCQYTDNNGCTAADTTILYVLQNYSYFMPTGFSPNADRINDVLLVKGIGIESIDLNIYDRVGEKVFESTDLLKGWDGTYLGTPMNEGEFVYTLVVTYCNQQVVKEQGSVMLTK